MALEPYSNAREDLAKVVAQEVSGVSEALPEQDDYDLADELLKFIRNSNLSTF